MYVSGFMYVCMCFEERFAYNLAGYGVTLLSGSIAASSGLAHRAVSHCRPIQMQSNHGQAWCSWEKVPHGPFADGAPKNPIMAPAFGEAYTSNPRRKAGRLSETTSTHHPPPENKHTTQRWGFGMCSFQPLWLAVCGPPPNSGGSTLFLAC